MKFLLIVLSICASMHAKADLGTVPAAYSCDEMYYAFTYDYERIREVWGAFNKPSSQCNKAVIDWIRDLNNVSAQQQEINSLLYAINDKEERLAFFTDPNINMLPEEMSLSFLQTLPQDEYFALLNDPSLGYRDLKTQQEMIAMAEAQYNKNPSWNWNYNESWRPPTPNAGVASVNSNGYYRIDHIGPPREYDELLALRCSDMYRGFGTCEQDCVYLRALAVDMHSKIRLFLKDWDWENDKITCTPQSRVKGNLAIFDAPYCKESCPGDFQQKCTSCSFRTKESDEKPSLYICQSEYDAHHAAQLFCNLKTGENCAGEVVCNTTFNVPSDEKMVVAGETFISEMLSEIVSLQGAVSGRIGTPEDSSLNIGLGFQGEIQYNADVSTGINLFSVEGPPLITKYFTERKSTGKVYECIVDNNSTEEDGNNYSSEHLSSCEDIYEVSELDNSELRNLCEDNIKDFGPCMKTRLGEGRAFYNCEATFENIKLKTTSAMANLGGDIRLGPAEAGVELAGSYSQGWQTKSTISTVSKKFNAGGITYENMKQTCQRWTELWSETTVKSFDIDQDNSWLFPETWVNWLKKGQSLRKDGYRVQCSSSKADGSIVKVLLSRLDISLGLDRFERSGDNFSEEEKREGRKTKAIKKLNRSLRVKLEIDKRWWREFRSYKKDENGDVLLNSENKPKKSIVQWPMSLLNILGDLTFLDVDYPSDEKTNMAYFAVPYHKKYNKYLAKIKSGDFEKSDIDTFFSELGSLDHKDGFKLYDCETIY